MTLAERLVHDLRGAIRASDTPRVATLRMLLAAIKNKEIEERKKEIGLGEEEIFSVIQKEAKKRRDAIAEYTKGKRDDLVSNEQIELNILEEYLPKELSDEEIGRIIRDGIRELESTGRKDFGSLMKIIMPFLKGKASGDRISKLAREALLVSGV
ncbi:MAG: hypothetical protein A3F26_03380 [Candidatus Ryanbacteria bacterium RIFCSPHIGHO2_12_FULL_47_12b]|uniref:Glutamyl-tRNA amidotransferase n=2 Tax=Candidatus Ryaniibacteriota TaxID=1817914 RepID=A0A1G2H6C8_9BACT|nr:MAG: hypothetical protein UX74_C0006G0005 [Parcubacteria group bacterium GW2011_GWA2_47_10b]OGZ46327.1 MAG: hypothetical protein A2844_02425 [Candidatus Ryanbacteria bacterium RIFCSPHIGHO2_01_FULL_48_80]OGZ50229.1 MAG: hypothetical protein A3C83_01565 [Candidatus Ryanbacteria bacterium RIFCSPHIGHO2_02_FULL_47_25]OGZ51545.1 MAG: hypothetical protein A3F26_03380 [Candidatus Ryanbacteria bacterium RIFCSPHIGHO2_12_FULL_47_12b]OGZ52864.1 MAG: hypothetical protein A3A29_01335 [Candidatus Ryanbacte